MGLTGPNIPKRIRIYMKYSSASKVSESEYPLSHGSKSYDPQSIHVSQEGPSGLVQRSVHSGKRFRGDLLIYFIAVGIWLFGTVWMVVKLIDRFF